MKKWVYRMFLSMLTVLPMASVAVAAESKLSEIEGERQTDELWKEILNARDKVFARGVYLQTEEDAFKYYMQTSKDSSSQDSIQQKIEFQKTLKILMDSGFISKDEKKVMSRPPSGYGA